MIRRVALFACCALVAALVGCSGIRQTEDGHFTAHAECFRIFGFPIPEDDQAAAVAKVPAGATIYTQASTPADWTSFTGILRNIVGFHGTIIAGQAN